jgi:hypothetical protein
MMAPRNFSAPPRFVPVHEKTEKKTAAEKNPRKKIHPNRAKQRNQILLLVILLVKS